MAKLSLVNDFLTNENDSDNPWLIRHCLNRTTCSGHAMAQAVSCLSPRSPGFAPGSVHVGFVVDKVTLGQVFLLVLRFFTVSIIPPSLSILIYEYHLGDERYVR
jgi:hypothetical protein